MLAMQGLVRPAGDHVTTRPARPNCGRSMHLARSTPGTDGLPDLFTYSCGECGVSVMEAGNDRVDRRG